MQKPSLLDKLTKELAQVEKQLEKYRTKCAVLMMESPTTQRRWKVERNWDYYGRRKFELQGLIEDEKMKLSTSTFFCIDKNNYCINITDKCKKCQL